MSSFFLHISTETAHIKPFIINSLILALLCLLLAEARAKRIAGREQRARTSSLNGTFAKPGQDDVGSLKHETTPAPPKELQNPT